MAHVLNDFLRIATTAAECVAEEPDRLASGLRALHVAVCRQVTQTTSSGRHLPADELREERRRMARVLHDRLGADINVAHRHLELYEILHDRDFHWRHLRPARKSSRCLLMSGMLWRPS